MLHFLMLTEMLTPAVASHPCALCWEGHLEPPLSLRAPSRPRVEFVEGALRAVKSW